MAQEAEEEDTLLTADATLQRCGSFVKVVYGSEWLAHFGGMRVIVGDACGPASVHVCVACRRKR